MGFAVVAFVLVAAHVAGLTGLVFAAFFAFAFSRLVEALLVGARVLGVVR